MATPREKELIEISGYSPSENFNDFVNRLIEIRDKYSTGDIRITSYGGPDGHIYFAISVMETQEEAEQREAEELKRRLERESKKKKEDRDKEYKKYLKLKSKFEKSK